MDKWHLFKSSSCWESDLDNYMDIIIWRNKFGEHGEEPWRITNWERCLEVAEGEI